MRKFTQTYTHLHIQSNLRAMAKIRKNVSIEFATVKIIKEIAEKEKRTESSVIDLAVQKLAADKKVAIT